MVLQAMVIARVNKLVLARRLLVVFTSMLFMETFQMERYVDSTTNVAVAGRLLRSHGLRYDSGLALQEKLLPHNGKPITSFTSRWLL